MRPINVILVVAFLSLSLGTSFAQKNVDDLSDYYGFGEIEIIKLDWGIQELRIADFNGDRRNDIAIANNRKARIELLIQKKAFGPGEIPVAVDPEDVDVNAINPDTRFEKQSVPVSQKMFSFVTGDLNSDGLMDLAFYGNPKGLYVILQKAAETKTKEREKLSWRTRKKFNIDDGLQTRGTLVCADLNNDGRDDLALAARDSVYIVLQKDDGSLAEPVKYAIALACHCSWLVDDQVDFFHRGNRKVVLMIPMLEFLPNDLFLITKFLIILKAFFCAPLPDLDSGE